MHFEHFSLSKLTKNSHLFSTPTVVLLSEADYKKGQWRSLFSKEIQARLSDAGGRLKEPLKAGARLCVPGLKKGEEDLRIALIPENKEMFFLLQFARDTLKEILDSSARSLRLIFWAGELDEPLADAFGAALSARTFLMPVFGKREMEQKEFQLKSVELYSESGDILEAFDYGFASAEGTNIARYLATLPPNILNPGTYGERIRQICKKNRISVKFYSKDQLRRMGAGAFTAVDQGNPESKGGIYELSYLPKKAKTQKTIHLVGKGMCFDTGGYDIKTQGFMIGMKGDMQGSAVALATLVTVANLDLPYKMKAYLAVTENHISPRAYKADEVVTALNGTTIEVINTDAEGRMVLADTLTLASREAPDLLLDFATLTGSAVRAIGTKYSAGFTNRDAMHETIRIAGQKSGERVWPFPVEPSFFKGLESKVADTLQLMKGGPDHIMAACFLSKFVEKDTPWVHVDLSASENEGGIGHVDSNFTGFGVRWALEFIKRA